MNSRTQERIQRWDSKPFTDGYEQLGRLADRGFSGGITADGAWLFSLNGRIVGIFDGELEDFETASGTIYEAPDPALPLLCSMHERGGEVRANYYTEETPLREVDRTLTDGSFTGYVELSEGVLSGDYYLVYYGGRRMAVAYIGNAERLLTGEEAFERAADEVGIYDVINVSVDVVDIPTRSTDAEPPAEDRTSGPTGEEDRSVSEPPADAAASSTDDEPDTERVSELEPVSEAGSDPVSESPPTNPTSESASTNSASADTDESTATPMPSADFEIDLTTAGRNDTSEEVTDSRNDTSEEATAGLGTDPEEDPADLDDLTAADTPPNDQSEATPMPAADLTSAEPDASESPPATDSESTAEGEVPQEPAVDADATDHITFDSDADTVGGVEDLVAAYEGDDEDETSDGDEPWTLDDIRDGREAPSDEGSDTHAATADVHDGSQPDSEHQPGTQRPTTPSADTRVVPSVDPENTKPVDESSSPDRSGGRQRTGTGTGTNASTSNTTDTDINTGSSATPSSSAPPEPSDEPASTATADRRDEPKPERQSEPDSEPETSSEEIALEPEVVASELDRLNRRVEELTAERDRLQSHTDEQEATIARLEAKIEDLEAEIERQTGSESAPPAGPSLTPDQLFRQTHLFIRYNSRSNPTLERALEDEAAAGDVASNLRLEHHTEFENEGATVDGQPYFEYLQTSLEYRFVDWLVNTLLYEIRNTDRTAEMADLYELLARIDRVDFRGTVSLADDDTPDVPDEVGFDVLVVDKRGKPLVGASITDSRKPVAPTVLESLEASASAVSANYPTFGAAFAVTSSFFEPGALEVTEQATSGGFLSRSSKLSYVNVSRKQGYHLCLVEARDSGFTLTVPEL